MDKINIICPMCLEEKAFLVKDGVLLQNIEKENRYRLELKCANCGADLSYIYEDGLSYTFAKPRGQKNGICYLC